MESEGGHLTLMGSQFSVIQVQRALMPVASVWRPERGRWTSWPLTSSLRGMARVRLMRASFLARPRLASAELRATASLLVRYSLTMVSYSFSLPFSRTMA